MGWIYRRTKRNPVTGTQEPTGPYWIGYYVNGHPRREGTRTWKHKEAERILKEREGRVAIGQPILPRADKICVEEILDDLRAHYAITGRRNLREADTRFVPLKAFFTHRRVSALSGAEFTRYVQLRQEAGVANGTINRELSVLGTALRLGEENRKVLRRPIIHLLKEADPRSGFLEEGQFQAVRQYLPMDLQAAITIAYTYGWRMQSEVLRLPLTAVDVKGGTLRLEPGMTKTKKARVVYLTPEITSLLVAQLDRIRMLSRRLNRVVPSLFPHLTTGSRAGTPRYDFRKAWVTACQRAGLVGMLRHDFRRSAVRNMVNLGIPERVAMSVTGHKTRSVFDRYHIVSPGDLQEATRKLSRTKQVQ